jgi:hypothetical protein
MLNGELATKSLRPIKSNEAQAFGYRNLTERLRLQRGSKIRNPQSSILITLLARQLAIGQS